METGGDHELLDIRAAARLVGRSPETIRRWVRSGRLPAHRTGNRLIVARSDLTTLAVDRGAPLASLREWAVTAREALEKQGLGGGSAVDLVLDERRLRSEGAKAAHRS